ncbi:MAG TPA: EAL domain-containing protein [Clostridia bacterium]|nr:EAL domain-containing protein [Clostridia bacterium]
MHKSRNTEDRTVGSSRLHDISRSVELAYIAVCASIYIVMAFALRYSSQGFFDQFIFFGVKFYNYVYSGIMAQIQVLACVYLVVNTMYRGYIAAILLNVYGIVFSAGGIIFGRAQDPLPGIIAYIGTILTVTAIYNYKNKLNRSIVELSRQKEELTSLYEEISVSQDKLYNQNEQLLKYNRIMKDNEKQLEQMAYYDTLTGLPNRKMIIEELENQLRSSEKDRSNFAFVFIDLDNFKEINDMLGHHVGDIILKAVVGRCMLRINEADLLGRLGGDEFALIIRRDLSRQDVVEYTESIKASISEVIMYETKEIYINASLGISMYPADGENSADLLKCADMAMYSVKYSGKNGIRFFSKSMEDALLRRVQLENGLKSALLNNELYVMFQPQYYCDTQKVRGFEVLARWHSEELGEIGPSEFIPIAEKTGLIVEIGEWILETAMEKFKAIESASHSNIVLSANISVVQILQPSFVKMVKKVLSETGFDAGSLEVEVTESILISYPEKVIDALNQLKAMGIRIALDDFGTGYASLKYFQILPIDTLKIDKSFIDKIDGSGVENSIINAIIAMAHEQRITVIAEGVENTIQLGYLKKHGCGCVQGFLLNRPLHFEQLACMPELTRDA